MIIIARRFTLLGLLIFVYSALPAKAANDPVGPAIWPDANMIGVIGDVISSANPDSTLKHFVTPKKSSSEPSPDQDYVLLKFVGSDDTSFDATYEWVGGDAGDAATKRKVPRDGPSWDIVKVRLKAAPNTVVATMYVWVVWVDMVATKTGPSKIDGVEMGIHQIRSHLGNRLDYEMGTGIDWTGTIQPTEIITPTDGERPALESQKRVSPPGPEDADSGVPSSTESDASNMHFSGWDMSRKLKMRAWTLANLTPFPADGEPAMFRLKDYPATYAEGNDDTSVDDEDDDHIPPVRAASGSCSATTGPTFPGLMTWVPTVINSM